MTKFIQKHPEICSLLLLALLCGLFLFMGINMYPLIDVDETRYAVMSRDMVNSGNWNLLMLNFVPFLEKPPLYFWLVGLSIKFFGNFSEVSVRFPIALTATFLVFFTYFFGKKVISRTFGLISSIVLLTSVFFLIFAHIAILDMILTVCIASALYSAFLTQVVSDKSKKYFWWIFWAIIGLGFLAKGLLALAIPATIVFLYCLLTKNLKEFFKPLHLIVGLLIFSVITLPWHIAVYQEYGNKFIKEYFLYHHFARFIDSSHIGRKHSLFYFVPVFFIAFMPWSIMFIGAIVDWCKKAVAKYKETQGKVLEKLYSIVTVNTTQEKFVLFSALFFIVAFCAVSVSSTKLPTYILPAIPPAALLTGLFWVREDNFAKKIISISTYILSAIFILVAISGFVSLFFMPKEILALCEPFKYFVIIGCGTIGLLLLLKAKQTDKKTDLLIVYILTMLFIITFAVAYLFNLMYTGGENELVNFSQTAKIKNAKLVTFDFAVKPSIQINYTDYVNYIPEPEFDKLYDLTDKKNNDVFIIVKNRHMEEGGYTDKIENKLHIVTRGKKYSLYSNKKSVK